MTHLREGLERITPDRVKRLPRDHRGFPIPWFVHTAGGTPDFRVVGPDRIVRALKLNLCWICGETLVRHKTFVIGPMCAVNRVTSEPPSHRSCAVFAAQACPFLTQPRMRRNENDIPEDGVDAPGIHLPHNPGVVCVWIARDFDIVPVDSGVLFNIGEPIEPVRWYCQGKTATRREVVKAMEKGLPFLFKLAEADGTDAKHALLQQIVRVRPYLPVREQDVKEEPHEPRAEAQDRGARPLEA